MRFLILSQSKSKEKVVYLCLSIKSINVFSNSLLFIGRPGDGVGVFSPSVDVDVSSSSSTSSMLRKIDDLIDEKESE